MSRSVFGWFGLLMAPIAGLVLAPAGLAQSLIFSQIADGANWRTAIVLTNTTTVAATASLTFYQQVPGFVVASPTGTTGPWNPPFAEASNTQNLSIPAGGTLYLHTPGTAATLTQGWGLLSGALVGTAAGPGITGYAIYTYGNLAGRADQDGTSPAAAAANRILVPFDNTPGFVTSLAIVNPNASVETVAVNIQTDDGKISTATLPDLPPNGQMAFEMTKLLPATAGHRGMAEFYLTAGTISMAALRFNPTIALTSSPVFPQTGPPIIGSTDSAGPAFITLSVNADFAPVGAPSASMFITVTPNSDGSYAAAISAASLSLFGTLSPGSASNSGQVFTFSTVAGAGGISTISNATLTFSLSHQPVAASGFASGTVTGTLSVTAGVSGATNVSPPSYSGTISGSYVQAFP